MSKKYMSEIIGTCYEHIIGLTRADCECLGCDEDAMISDSDLYLDELEPLNSTLIKGREDCEKGDLCEILYNARSEAVKQFKSDLKKELLKWNDLAREKYSGSIGSLKYTQSINLSGNYSGVRFMCADVRSGYLRIKNIRTIFEQDLTFDLFIFNNINELVDTIQLNAVANELTSNVVDIELPLHYDFLDNTKYFFMYENTGKTPKNVGVNCTWDTLKPCFTKYHKGWESWLMVSGYSSTDLTNFIDSSEYTGSSCHLNGLIFDVEIICKADEVICKDSFDFEGNPLAMSSAFAVRYRAGINLIDSLLGDTELNRYVMANRETLVNFRMLFLQNYEKEIAYLGEHIDINLNDCFACKDKYGFSKKSIIL